MLVGQEKSPMYQHEFEFDIYQCLEYGDEGKIAREAGKGANYYSEMFNPDNPRESIFFRAAQDFENWIRKVNKDGGLKAYRAFCARIDAAIAGDSESTLAECHKESSEGVQAGIEDRPIAEQKKEAREAMTAWAARYRLLEEQEAQEKKDRAHRAVVTKFARAK